MSTDLDVVIAMPAFNEQLAIPSFIAEISEAFSDLRFHIVVVNDFSTDGTLHTLSKLSTAYPLKIVNNPQNIGHGASTLKALSLAAELSAAYVVSTDGDGHISGAMLRQLYDESVQKKWPTVIEGARAQRDDPWFRKIVSAATRLLVRYHSGHPPTDANTPFRVYPTQILSNLLAKIEQDHMTPNLVMSTLVRRDAITFGVIPLAQQKREGTIENGSTWNQKLRLIPSRRFLQFCAKATAQWITPSKKIK